MQIDFDSFIMDVDPRESGGGGGEGGGGEGGGGTDSSAVGAAAAAAAAAMSAAGGGTSSSSGEVSMEHLFSQFGCMQTLDRKDLIDQVRRLIGDANITDEAAKFYLEMNQFNVGAAVGAYFDLEAGTEAKAAHPKMTFVKDVTIGEGDAVPPDTTFIKTWQVRSIASRDQKRHENYNFFF